MKLPLNWLKSYIDPKLSTDALVERLTMAGLEVEAVEPAGNDTVLEIEITPNRPDLLCLLGLGREISAITGKPFKAPGIKAHRAGEIKGLVSIENKNDCSRYVGTLIRGVSIKSSPAEIQKHLLSVGIKAINNAVDITNFVLMEQGQPLHAFDFDQLAGGKIIVRRAKHGETIVTLDGVERKLDSSILVIADAAKPVAIAGIMGGQGTEITTNTQNILLESAHFDMGLIRRASRALGLRSDSSYRFERHVNFDGVLTGANRATDMLLDLTGGKLAGRHEVMVKTKITQPKIKVSSSEIESVLGLKVKTPQAKTWISKLGFGVTTQKDALTVTVPSTRPDIRQPVDVIEEIARMIGFDRLPEQMPVIKSINITVEERPRQIKSRLRGIMAAHGIDETVSLSMISSKALTKCGMGPEKAVRIFNPLSQDQELLRSSMLPSLLQTAVTNINRGQRDLRFYEIGKRYFLDGEKETLSILMTGRRSQDWRLPRKDTVEFFDLKGIVGQVFNAVGVKPLEETNQWPVLDSGCATSLTLNGKYLGSFGRVDKKILNQWDIKNQDIFVAGIHLDEIYPWPDKILKYEPISEFPATTRDVSLAVKIEVCYKEIEEICKAQGGDMLKSVQFIEQYLGDKIQAGHKGLVFSCQYQSNARTLREDEVTAVHERIVGALIKNLGAVRR